MMNEKEKDLLKKASKIISNSKTLIKDLHAENESLKKLLVAAAHATAAMKINNNPLLWQEWSATRKRFLQILVKRNIIDYKYFKAILDE